MNDRPTLYRMFRDGGETPLAAAALILLAVATGSREEAREAYEQREEGSER